MNMANGFINLSFWRDFQIASVKTMQWGIHLVTHAAKLIDYKYFIRLIYSQSNGFIVEGDRVQLLALILIFS